MTDKQFYEYLQAYHQGDVSELKKELHENAEKRFTIKLQDDLFGINDNNVGMNVINGILTEIEAKWLCDLMNELNEEKEDWKNNCLISVSENSILWNEIFILMEQGAEPSDAFKNYLNNLKNKNNKLQGD